MPEIRKHVPDSLLLAYAAGTLPEGFALVVASHVSLCDECRAALEAHWTCGGAVLETLEAAAPAPDLRQRCLDNLDAPVAPEPRFYASGPLPAPVMATLGGDAPRWQRLGRGVHQCILKTARGATARLLSIPPGCEMPDHGHNGLELTLVLQGSFEDEFDRFSVGDLEVADEDTEHRPVARGDLPCICLAATDAPLRFSALLPRMLQPLFRI